MNELDKAWLAGIIDGEGCIRIKERNHSRYADGVYYILMIYVNSVDHYMIPHIQSLYPGTISRHTKLYGSDNWGWEISGKRAYELLKELISFLRVKHEQAGKAIEFFETCKQRGQHTSKEIQKTYMLELSSLKNSIKIGNI